jgi:Zn-dependent peptidase ImmA (M78 family)
MTTQSNTIKKGNVFEELIHRYFFAEIQSGRFFAKRQCCKIRKKPKYHSRDRSGDITFDISIEISLPGATEFSYVVLIECKSYTHPVPVDDVEEFFAKVQQVAPAKAKAVLASTASFQSGTREFARAKGIGLLRYFNQENCKWELRRSPSGGMRAGVTADASEIASGLSNPDHKSEVFDLYLQSPTRDTNSLYDFFKDIFFDDTLSTSEIRKAINLRPKQNSIVPFIEKDELENVAARILKDISYMTGKVPLQQLCEYEADRSGLVVNLNVRPSSDFGERQVLGRITFDPPRIEVYRQVNPTLGRTRFTLAHELAHHLLGHGKYMRREYCQDADFSFERQSAPEGTDIEKMEFQANFLASNLLLPKANVIEDFQNLVHQLELPNRGYGQLYLDTQPCNIQSFERITAHFMRQYGVSRTAITIRLQSLGLLHDARKLSGSKQPTRTTAPFAWP